MPSLPSHITNGDHSSAPRRPALNLNGGGDYDSDAPESPSSVVSLSPDEFPAYFTERGGRLFHSTLSPYPLPVDTPEQERMTIVHDLLRHLHGSNYVGPVPEILRLDPHRRKSTLDVSTGNGKWVIEMASEFPHVVFTGFDNVPIATRYPPSNVQFEIHDVNTRFRWADNTFDVVHARAISMATSDYRAALGEMMRVLRPGGLFVSSEWGHHLYFAPPYNLAIATDAPASHRFHGAVNDALESCRGLRPISAQIPSFLASFSELGQTSSRIEYVPIGAWSRDPSRRSIGELNLIAHERFADSVKPLLADAGWSEIDTIELVREYIQEIRVVDGLASVLYTVHAQKD